jgi:hypothetical protein
MENEVSRRRAVVCWRTGRSPECDREGHPEPGRKAHAKTPKIRALFQTVSCSDGVRRSTRHTTEGTVALEPQVVREKEEMLAELRGVRERTLAFIAETSGRDLRKYRLPHLLGSLNAYPWLQFIAAHEKRHMKRMREIAGMLPKTVTSLHK